VVEYVLINHISFQCPVRLLTCQYLTASTNAVTCPVPDSRIKEWFEDLSPTEQNFSCHTPGNWSSSRSNILNRPTRQAFAMTSGEVSRGKGDWGLSRTRISFPPWIG
jgi:hypothetical protein